MKRRVTMLVLVLVLVATVGCHRLERNSDDLTPEEIVARSTHLFIGVIESHEFANRLLYWPGWEDSGKWTVTRRRVRVENVLRGEEKRRLIDVYEVFPTGGLTGPWNFTQNGQRYLFPVRRDGEMYRLSRDFWRSIYKVVSGRHAKLPLTDAVPFWERFGLLQWIPGPDRSAGFAKAYNVDWLGFWRTAKALRGLLRHAEAEVRINACEGLLELDLLQDECWDGLPPADKQRTSTKYAEGRNFLKDARAFWRRAATQYARSHSAEDMDLLRVATTVNDVALRREFCTDFRKAYPADQENGCSESRPVPATVVTEAGDIPLIP